MENEYADD
jgi:protein LTV1